MKTEAHVRYRNKAGKVIPGVTTITGILNKPALVKWANNLGLQGIDSTKYVDNLAEVGTLAHYLIMCHLMGATPDTSNCSEKQIDQAENCVLSFLEWEKAHHLEPILIETPLVSEAYQFGGTLDCYAKLDGSLALIDFKTGKAIYPEMIYQLAAYRQLLFDNGYGVNNARILRIGRDEDEGFEEKQRHSLDNEWEIFKDCLDIHRRQKEVR